MRLSRFHTIEGLFKESLWFREGLFGFEREREFILTPAKGQKPYLKLAASTAEFSFLVVDPFLLFPRYHPAIPYQDIELLEAQSLHFLFLLAIVNPKTKGVNLRAPLLIDWNQKKGRQIHV